MSSTASLLDPRDGSPAEDLLAEDLLAEDLLESESPEASLLATTAVELAPAPLPLAVEEAYSFVHRELTERLGQSTTLVLHLPAPLTMPEVLLGGATDSGFLWDAPGGPYFAGRGVAHAIEVHAPGRPADLRRRAEKLFRRIETVDHPQADGPEPRLFGGLAFQAGGADEEIWSPFGDGSFTLPRWLYARRGSTASLSLALRCEKELPSPALRRELREVLEALIALPAPRRGLPRAGEISQMPREEWAGQVEAIRAAIQRQDFQKIVAARRARVELEGPLDPLALLQRLRLHQDPTCRRFAFFRGQSAFLGATPERLILRRGARIETEALAGSIGSGREQAARLLDSQKDQVEHALVVEHIVDGLKPLCSELEWNRQPRIRELRNLLHLNTPIRGCLREATHVLELVESLHPTPAVGGVPAAEATQWIAAHEHHPRGWYAGPIGWFTASGDGEFDVALRSCLLTGSTALLYAGAGIMLDSDPDREYQETDLKQRSLLAALGVGG